MRIRTGIGLMGGLSAFGYGGYYIASKAPEWIVNSISKISESMPDVMSKTPEIISEVISKTFKQTIEKTGESINDALKKSHINRMGGTLGQEISKGTDEFLEGLDLGSKGELFGQEVGGFWKEASKGIGNGAVEMIRNIFGKMQSEFFWNQFPYILGGIAATTATPLIIRYTYERLKHNIGRPKLATEVKQLHMLSPITERIASLGRKTPATPIYSPEISSRLSDLIKSVENLRKHGGYFQNVLFYGPGGTGKTMISEWIARQSGLSYVKMSGGDLAQYVKRGEHVTELNNLMNKVSRSWRPWSSRPWILFIDEAESLCRDRSSKTMTAELLELQNAFLNRTGTQSKRFMLILATNRMEDLDEAVLSRMDYKIHIGPPAEPERTAILKSYIPQFFTQKDRTQFFADKQVEAIAREIDGFTGRGIFKMLNMIANKKLGTADGKLSQEIIEKTLSDCIGQEKEIDELKKAKAQEH